MKFISLYFSFFTVFVHVNAFFPNFGRKLFSVQIRSTVIEETVQSTDDRVIKITPSAMEHLLSLKSKQSDSQEFVLRMGVRAGGCSGMSYILDIIKNEEIREEDHIEEYQGIKCAVDPKSLLFLYGLQLDYSAELIGGGFKFMNPNAESSCGCGKSFNV